MLHLINASATGQNRTATFNVGGQSPRTFAWPGNVPLPTGNILGEQWESSSFNLGPGVTVNSTGRVLYSSQISGSGLLDNLLIINRGNSTAYWGINNSDIRVNAGTPIASGQSYQVENPDIRMVWAICGPGETATIAAQGVYRFNSLQV